MVLKLPWFRHQLKLGSLAQMEVAIASYKEEAVRPSSVPERGVFTQWIDTDNGPPPVPVRNVPLARKKSRPITATPAKANKTFHVMKEQNRYSSPSSDVPREGRRTKTSKTAPPIHEVATPKQTSKEVARNDKTTTKTQMSTSTLPLPSKSNVTERRSAPSSRRNPNAPAFMTSSIITNPSSVQAPAARPQTVTKSAQSTPRPITTAAVNQNVSVGEFANDNLSRDKHPSSESPATATEVNKRATKSQQQKKTKKQVHGKNKGSTGIKNQMAAPGSPPLTQPNQSMDNRQRFEEDGSISFTEASSHRPIETFNMSPYIMAGFVADSEECEA